MAQLVTFAPPLLFKFRSPTDRNIKTLLRDRCLFASSPADLNDPFDCRPAIAIPPVGMRAAVTQKLAALATPHTVEEVRRRCRLLMTSPLHREAFLDELYEEDIGRFGVLSLSIPRDHPLLWAHYAQEGRGFAVGYRSRTEGDKEALPAAPVKYTAERPHITVPGTEVSPMAFFSKSPHWAHEQEWRFIRTPELGGPGLIEVPQGAIVEVCLGPRMSPLAETKVVDAARSLPDAPRILRAELMPDRYGISFGQV